VGLDRLRSFRHPLPGLQLYLHHIVLRGVVGGFHAFLITDPFCGLSYADTNADSDGNDENDNK
jgi:hypothetical protein